MGIPSISYFRSIHNSLGVTHQRDVKLYEFQRQFADEFDTSINVEHDVLRNGERQDFIIVPTDSGCNLWARPGETLNIGDIIFFNALHWLVTDIQFGDSLARRGSMVRCNRKIRWQNQRTGEIVERWCLAEKPYSTNVADGLTIGTSTREYKIRIPYDEETMQVDLDRRFLLEVIAGVPRAYKLTSTDTVTNRYVDIDGGFLVWNMEQTEYNPLVDNADFMIANYFEPGTTPDPSEPDVPPDPVPPEEPDAQKLLCKIEGRNTIREGTSRTYTAVFYGEDGVSVTDDVNAVWTVDAPTDAVTMEQDGAVLRLTYYGGMNVGDLIHISVRDDLSLYETALCDVEVIEFL